MQYYSCGQIIKRMRQSRGLTQEELAFGICSVSSLSKIENGRQTPHYRTFEALLERLGIQTGGNSYPDKKENLRCFGVIVCKEK